MFIKADVPGNICLEQMEQNSPTPVTFNHTNKLQYIRPNYKQYLPYAWNIKTPFKFKKYFPNMLYAYKL